MAKASKAGRHTSAKQAAARRVPEGWVDPLRRQQPLASVPWLAAALVATLVLAAGCVYLAICLLFWQGQWQLVFHPSTTISRTPAALGLKYDEIRFDATETGVLQLDGWWVPADPGAAFAGETILLLRDGAGSLSNSAELVEALHAVGANVFAFDYRGFGGSVPLHPSEKSTTDDAEAAWRYLTETRHVRASSLVLYGEGLGGTLAAELAARHGDVAGVILQNLPAPVIETLRREPRANILPLGWLVHDRFDPGGTLAHLATPKLFLEAGPGAKEMGRYYAQTAEPKRAVVLAGQVGSGRAWYADPAFGAAVAEFLRSIAAR